MRSQYKLLLERFPSPHQVIYHYDPPLLIIDMPNAADLGRFGSDLAKTFEEWYGDLSSMVSLFPACSVGLMLNNTTQIHVLRVPLIMQPLSDVVKCTRDATALQFLYDFPIATILVVLNTHSTQDGTVVYWQTQGTQNPRTDSVAQVSSSKTNFILNLMFPRSSKSVSPPRCGNS